MRYGARHTATIATSASVGPDFTLSASGSGSATLSLTLTPNLSLTGTATGRAFMDPRTRNAGERSLSGSVVTVQNDAANNGFPGIAKLATGDLIAVYRAASASHTSLDGILKQKTSSDGGATWSSATTIIGTGSVTDYRDPGVLVCADGTVVVSFFTATDNDNFDNQVPMTIRSTDDGATWSSPVTVTHPFVLAAACSAPPIQLQSGDLLMPVYGWDSLAGWQNISVARSTDLGVSWSNLASVFSAQTNHHLSECNLLQMGNGEIIALVRDDHSGSTDLQVTYSRDLGATWDSPTVAFTNAGGRAALVEGPERDILVMYRDHVNPSYGQTFWRSSWDFGRTWSASRTINSSRVYTYGQWVTIDAAGGNDALAVVYAVEPAANNADVFFQKFTAPATPNFTFTATGTATGSLSIASNDLSMTATGTGFGTLTLHPPSANTAGTVRLRFSRAHPVDLTFSLN